MASFASRAIHGPTSMPLANSYRSQAQRQQTRRCVTERPIILASDANFGESLASCRSPFALTSRWPSSRAADPLNLVGIVLPGACVPVIPTNRILYRDGVPIAVLEAGQERYLVKLEKASEWPARKALIHRPVPPQLKAYLGRSA